LFPGIVSHRSLFEHRAAREADWCNEDRWLVKSALCNTGDTVMIRSLMTSDQWRQATKSVGRCPDNWVAQERFATCPVQTSKGPIYPCIGVYTVNGRAAGIYGRFSSNLLIDFAAVDAAVLIVDD